MLSSAWNALTGRKHSRDEEKKEADEHKQFDMQAMPSKMSTPSTAPAAPGGPTSSSPAVLSVYDGPAMRTRKRSKNEQQLRGPPTPTIAVAPASAATLSYVAPPLHAPIGAAPAPHPEHPPPSYEASLLHQYPIASVQKPVVFIDGHPEQGSAPAPVVEEWKEGERKEGEEYKHPSALPLPIATPPMSDAPSSLSQRLAGSALTAFAALQSHPTYQRGQAKALALASKHIPPEVVDFLQAPSLGKLLRHPTMLLVVYRLYAAVRAPFIGVFRVVLVNAAKRALWRRKQMSEAELKTNAAETNAAINEGLKQAIGRDMNVNLSPEVCRQIVENIDMKQLQDMFGWFETTPVADKSGAVVAPKKKK